MKAIEINIDLDPVNDGASIKNGKIMPEKKGALIIGTNGKYRFASCEETYELVEKLMEVGDAEDMGKSHIIIYNTKKVLKVDDRKFLVGSAIIVKSRAEGLGFLSEDEIEAAKAEFESRLATLCGGGIEFSAYEID